MSIQLDKYRDLSRQLREFSRKCSYQFRDEPMGPESDAWRRVVEQFVGKRELRGNELWGERGETTGTSWSTKIKRSVCWVHRMWSSVLRRPTQRSGLTCRRSPGAIEEGSTAASGMSSEGRNEKPGAKGASHRWDHEDVRGDS
jgi:hypothetical protein